VQKAVNMTTNEAPTAAEHPLLALARSASALLSSISAYPTSKSPSPDVAEELMSIVAITSSLLIALNSSLDQRLGWKSQSSPFVGPLCREIEAGLGEVRKKVDEGRKKNCGSVEKSLEWKPLVLGGEQVRILGCVAFYSGGFGESRGSSLRTA
jgi:hypothetical protein